MQCNISPFLLQCNIFIYWMDTRLYQLFFLGGTDKARVLRRLRRPAGAGRKGMGLTYGNVYATGR